MAVRNALKGAMLTGAVAATCGAASAQAQQQGPTTANNAADTTLQEVVVTGSRIKQPALEAVSPVTAVSVEEIQQSGSTRIEDILNQLPQVVGDMGSALANGATGAATVSLRGLGCQRTLVLVNGRRLMPGDPTEGGTSCSDLNQIPTDLVEGVDILTGGASAVYGADAVAGVVNFKMNDHFEGVRLDAGTSFYNHSQHNGTAVDDLNAAGFTVPTGSTTAGATPPLTLATGTPIRCCRVRATSRRAL
jgi:outer membrane cobalamin receptor